MSLCELISNTICYFFCIKKPKDEEDIENI